MATVATQTPPGIPSIQHAVTQDTSDQFIQGAIDQLSSDKGTYADNVLQVATWAIEIDEAFDRVTRGLTALTQEFATTFPDLTGYLNEWKGYNSRWVAHLALSRDVASEHIAVLTRFDKIFIEMVQNIKTNEDRLDVIDELGQFANEDHDRSTEMSQNFLNLKRDIEDYVTRFDAWIEKTGTALAERAKVLTVEIEGLKKELQSLDKQIEEATKALLSSAAGASTLFGVIGLIVTGTTLAVFVGQRVGKAKDLQQKQKDLDEVNRQQKALAKVKTDFDGLKPDIALICDRLVLFAEIWSSVRSQTVQFQVTLQGGMGAVTNMRFKQELRLARELCTPLKDGLAKYATALVNRASSASDSV